jgi:hypothetical protein
MMREVRKFLAMEVSYMAFRLSLIALKLESTNRRRRAVTACASAIHGGDS